jgi:UDPglucose 6-dehydrogenase
VIALHNPHVRVTVVDRDQKRIDAWMSRHLPIHEPGLEDVVRIARDGSAERRSSSDQARAGAADGNATEAEEIVEAARKPNLFFTTACVDTIKQADMCLISVNTPTKMRGMGAGRATDMTAFEGACRDVAEHAKAGTILVEKSTVPCKTGQLIKDIVCGNVGSTAVNRS